MIALERLDVAERLYRVTGTGLYRDSLRLGLEVPIRHPLVNAGVAGQDSVQAVLYRGRVFWIWGDTPSIAHPLWNFHTSGATSQSARATEAWIPRWASISTTWSARTETSARWLRSRDRGPPGSPRW